MVYTANGNWINRDELQVLYRHAIDNFRYQHTDVWRGQQFYTTLNVGIIGVSVTLLREVDNSLLPAFALLSIGAFFSFFGLKSVERLRKFFLQAIVYKVMIEDLLGYHSNINNERIENIHLAVHDVFPKPDDQKKDKDHFSDLEFQLSKPNEWVDNMIWNRGGITYYFLWLQRGFLGIDVFLLGYLTSLILL